MSSIVAFAIYLLTAQVSRNISLPVGLIAMVGSAFYCRRRYQSWLQQVLRRPGRW